MAMFPTFRPIMRLALAGAFFGAAVPSVLAHGDVNPQPVDTSSLPKLGEEWLEENPWRTGEVWAAAVKVGDSGFNQNCARCHGLGAVSGGLAPDLRFLTADGEGDEWFVERFMHGYTQDGVTKMPAFGELLGQEAAWAIRTYIETRAEDGALDAHADKLKGIRDTLAARFEETKTGKDITAMASEVAALRADLAAIGAEIKTASGAPVAESAVTRAAALLDGTPEGLHKAAEALTIGLSAAQ